MILSMLSTLIQVISTMSQNFTNPVTPHEDYPDLDFAKLKYIDTLTPTNSERSIPS